MWISCLLIYWELAATGTPYVAFEHGPVISDYQQIFRVLELLGEIEENGRNSYVIKKQTFQSELSDVEFKIVEYVWNSFKNKLGEMRNHSHDESGWKDTDSFDLIDYNLSKPLKSLKEDPLNRIVFND
ncbi:MAG: DUF4065 domain-containing protein [Bdellovibrionota bacterium]